MAIIYSLNIFMKELQKSAIQKVVSLQIYCFNNFCLFIFQTTLGVGHYCDVFSGHYTNEGECTGTEIDVHSDGTAKIALKAGDPNGAIFIYSGVCRSSI